MAGPVSKLPKGQSVSEGSGVEPAAGRQRGHGAVSRSSGKLAYGLCPAVSGYKYTRGAGQTAFAGGGIARGVKLHEGSVACVVRRVADGHKKARHREFAPYALLIDGDTGQVGPEIASHLGLPQLTYAVNVVFKDGEALCKRLSDECYDMISVQLPAVVTVDKTEFEPRYPTLKSKMAARKKEIKELTFADLESIIDETRIGLKGSPTKVRKTFTPNRTKNTVIINEEEPEASAVKLVGLLSEAKVL